MPLKHRVFRAELVHTRIALYVAKSFMLLQLELMQSFAVGRVKVLAPAWLLKRVPLVAKSLNRRLVDLNSHVALKSADMFTGDKVTCFIAIIAEKKSMLKSPGKNFSKITFAIKSILTSGLEETKPFIPVRYAEKNSSGLHLVLSLASTT